MERQSVAKYQILDIFKITGRGLAFAGVIIEGVVSKGDEIEFLALNKFHVKDIADVEGIYSPKSAFEKTGLLIQCVNEQEIDELRNWQHNNVICLIYKTSI